MTDRYYLTENDRNQLSELLRRMRAQPMMPPVQGVPPRPEPIPMLLAKATETIAATGTTGGKARRWRVSSSGAEEAAPTSGPGSTDHVYDWFGTGASSGDKLMTFRHRQSGRLYFLKPSTLDRRCEGLIKSTVGLSSTMPSVNVDNIQPIVGANPTSTTTGVVSVANPMHYAAPDNAICKFEWNSTQWELYNVQHQSVVPVVDVQVAANTVQIKQQTWSVMRQTSASTWESIHFGTTCT